MQNDMQLGSIHGKIPVRGSLEAYIRAILSSTRRTSLRKDIIVMLDNHDFSVDQERDHLSSWGSHFLTPRTLRIVWEHDDVMVIHIHDITCQLIARGGYLDRPVIRPTPDDVPLINNHELCILACSRLTCQGDNRNLTHAIPWGIPKSMAYHHLTW